MMKNIFLLGLSLLGLSLLVFNLSSCCFGTENDNDEEIPYILQEVNNKELQQSISEYMQLIDFEYKPKNEITDSVYVGVRMSDISQFVKEYALFPISGWTAIMDSVPFIICSVKGRDVFFFIEAGRSSAKGSSSFFVVSDESKLLLKRKYFPLTKNRKSSPQDYHSTFYREFRLVYENDSLIRKSYDNHGDLSP